VGGRAKCTTPPALCIVSSTKAKFPVELVQGRRKFLEKPSVCLTNYRLFDQLTLVWGAATFVPKILRIGGGGLIVATSAQYHQRNTGELARR
jgi:hypothetical protein